MRLLILAVLPAAAGELAKIPADKPEANKPEPPPSPPPVAWEVWGYKWENGEWVKQPDYCLKTTDMKKAVAYTHELIRYNGWVPAHNLPKACIVTYAYTHHDEPQFARTPANTPPDPVYKVWAFNLTGGKWVKNDEYSWSTGHRGQANDRLVALDQVKRIDAVPGWCATANVPCDMPENQRYAFMGRARSVENKDGDYDSGYALGYKEGYPAGVAGYFCYRATHAPAPDSNGSPPPVQMNLYDLNGNIIGTYTQ